MNTFYILRAQTRVAVLHQIALNWSLLCIK
jgi:hypothetical protein